MSNLYLNGFRDAFLGSGIVKKTLSSLKDPLNSSRNYIKSLSSKGKANRDQNSKRSKRDRKQKKSKLKGILIFIHKNCDNISFV